MKWLLLFLLLLVAAGVVVLLRARLASPGQEPSGAPEQPRRRCVRCHGTGWLDTESERTLEVNGDGFTDRHRPATMCPTCGGTGIR